MALLDDIGKAGDNHVAILIGVVSLLVPGAALIAAYFPMSLENLDFFKIFFIAMVFGTAVSTPLFISLASRYLGGESNATEDNNTGVALFVLSTVISGIISSIITLLFWLLSLDLKVYLVVHAILFYVIIPLILTALLHYEKKST